MEYLDIVDENGNPTGETVERSFAHRNGVWHRTSHVWILRKREGKIEVLLWADVDEKSLTLQEEEVSAVKWMDLDECIEGVKVNAFKHCIYPEELLMVKKRALA